MEEKLKNIYYTLGNEGAYATTPSTITRAFKKRYPQTKIKTKNIKDFLEKQESYSLHRNARRHFPRNKVYVPGPNIQWCCDLMDFKPFVKENRQYRYILTCLDCFTRYAYAQPLKTKTSSESLLAFKKIIESAGVTPNVLETDLGGEFINKSWQSFLKSKNIKYFISQGIVKNSICERFNRTFSDKLFRYFDAKHVRNWVDVLQDLITSYNGQYHRSIGTSPNNVKNENYIKVYKKLYGSKVKKKKGKLKVGDIVRLSRLLRFVDKAYENRWSRAIFEVSKGPFYPMLGTIPMYKIREIDTKVVLPGSYYEHELLLLDRKVYYENFVFPIEKRLRYRKIKNKREVLVKWLGYNSTKWVPLTDLKNINHK